ncbi:hypothetical protein C499_08712 [Halogeometricum borinquense DSM 11551]|uniref:Uncharacterized protein n=2 Tax=Halogeometricum borinquense TaxID=60847 RepID=E4NME6_HALBP|nr:hypothetical protein [Halogeometricum borinquense]ADQ68444.1 hypothetical protein Hbor_29050 [Halogeometricum borinquense DSM 11551]ELY27912.1 hypothetical protein C499_08712 [Halogeometricum borinquense DSM 11551]RYJ15023.1 hypothetical protein ELS19_14400 [Halogeometricum borinquense]
MTHWFGELDENLTVHASFAWFGLFLFGVLFLAVMLWSFLDGPQHMLFNMSNSMADSSRGEETVRRYRLLWEYWPLWGAALAALLISFRRSINETGRRF